MDAVRFDLLIRSVTADIPRRPALGVLAGVGLAALLTNTGSEDAAAKRKRRKKKCKGGTKKCGKRCISPSSCCSDGECGNGGACVGDTCLCLTGFKACLGGCIPEAEACGGCSAGLQSCGGTCVDLKTDPNHCGACGRVCPGGCLHGACRCPGGAGCPAGCVCGDPAEGGVGACEAGLDPSRPCDNPISHDVCPLGSFCHSNFLDCTIPCPG